MPDDGVVPFFYCHYGYLSEAQFRSDVSINISLSIPDNVIRG